MKPKYKPYGFNERYEYRTYKNIGRDYGNRKYANMGLIYNAERFLRRKINTKEKSYAMCDTYLQWKKYVEKNLEKNLTDNENYMHWLIKQQRHYKERLEAIKVILIPLYIFILTILLEGAQYNGTQILVVTIFAEIIMCVSVMKDTSKCSFYGDYIEVIEEILKQKEMQCGKKIC